MSSVGSRFPVGSSASRMAGSFTIALAIATRCCSPPESSFGNDLYFCCKSDQRKQLAGTFFLITLGRCLSHTQGKCNIFINITILQKTEILEYNIQVLFCIWRCFCVSYGSDSAPLTMIVPSVGFNSFMINLISVDLPEPLSPTMNTNSPRSIFTDDTIQGCDAFGILLRHILLIQS